MVSQPLSKRAEYDADAAYFELLHDWYRSGRWRARVRGVFSEVRPYLRSHARALDVGCAIGTFAIELARVEGVSVTALDFSQTALARARANAQAEGVAGAVQFVAAEAERIALKGSAYDLVIAADVIEHLQDPDSFLAEARRLLKPGGVLVLETCNTEFRGFSFYPRLRRWADRLGLPDSANLFPMPADAAYAERYHIALRSYPRLLEMVREAGLTVVRHRPFGWWLDLRGLDRLTWFACHMLRPVYPPAAYYENTDVIIVAQRPLNGAPR